MKNQPTSLLTVGQLAAMLQVERQTVYAWIRSGKLTGRKAGKGWRIDASEVERFLLPEKQKPGI